MTTAAKNDVEANWARRLRVDKQRSATPSSLVENQCPGGHMLVDVGCGTGAFARRVRGRYDSVVGIDFIPLKRFDSENVHLVRADLRHGIPLGEGVADTVTAIEVIEHIANPILLAREAFRVARPGGKFVLTTPNVRYVRQLFRLIVRGEGPRTAGRYDDELLWDGGHIHYFTSKDLAAVLKEVGFVSIRSMALIRSEGFLPVVRRWLWRWPGNPLVREFLTGRLLIVGTRPRDVPP